MARHLFVIEAPGKRKAFGEALRAAGLRDVDVVATVGHLCANPAGFKPLAITAEYRERSYGLRADREHVADQINARAQRAHKIYLATDADQEGDVIARDVMRFCISSEDRPKALRMRLRSLSPTEVSAALQQAQVPDELSACQGDARRIVDRLIGSLSSEHAAVGRVQGSLLLELQGKVPVVGVLTHTAPGADGREVWVARQPVFAGEPVAQALSLDEAFEIEHRAQATLGTRVMTYDEILLSASLATDRGIGEVAQALQELYESAQMTYPRARHGALTPEAVRRVTAIARANGAGFVPEMFPAVRQAHSEHAHEAPNPMVIGLALNRDLFLLPFEQQVLVHVARRLIECGVPCELQLPMREQVAALPEPVRHLRWTRKVARGAVLWDEPVKAGFESWAPEQSLLHFMSKNKMGRASTIVSHIEKFLSRDLVDAQFELTAKGRQWSAHIGRIFSYENIAQKVEHYIDENRKDAAQMVRDIVQMCALDIPVEQTQEVEHDDFEVHTKDFS